MVNAKLIAITGVITIAAVTVLAVVYKSGGGSSAYATVGDLCADVENPSLEVQGLCKELNDVGMLEDIFCGPPGYELEPAADDDAGLMASASAEAGETVTVQCKDLAHMCTANKTTVEEHPEITPERMAIIKQHCQTSCSYVPPDAKPPADMTFTMDEILSALDVNAKWDEVYTRCSQNDRRLEEIEEKILSHKAERALSGKTPNLREMIQKEKKFEKNAARRLVFDEGWCSTNIGFITGFRGDSSDYCNPTQECDSNYGCNYQGDVLSKLTECCVVHDKCLESDPTLTGDRLSVCSQQNCKGKTCDINLGKCAYKKSCGYVWESHIAIYPQCVAVQAALVVFMGGIKPQAEWNTGGADSDSCCKEGASMDCGGTPLKWRESHRHSPHSHSPHSHRPHWHWPHGHLPGW